MECYYIVTCFNAINMILAPPTMPCIHLVMLCVHYSQWIALHMTCVECVMYSAGSFSQPGDFGECYIIISSV